MNSVSRKIAGAIFAAAMLLPLSALAEAWPPLEDVPAVEPSKSHDVAVIVAVEDYLLLPDVKGAVDNANDWELFLRNGLRVDDVHVLANQDVTRESMLKFAETAAQDVGPGGTVWWIFIGHGAPSVSGKDGLLIGMDAQQSVESLEARGLAQKDLLNVLEAGKGRTVMIVDACFSGRDSDGEALAAGVQPVIAVDPTTTLGPTSVVLSAARATEVAGRLPGGERPAFSYLVLGAMRGWADDGDGQVTAEEALYYTQRQLRGVKGRTQTPQAVGNLQVVLARGVNERQPQMVDAGLTEEKCAEGEVRQDGKCVAAQATNDTGADGRSEAERTLEYLQRRIVFDGRTPRQGNRVISGPNFYNAIDRPDLADKWRGHNPYMWVPGIVATAGGIFLFVYGIAHSQNDNISRDAQTGWFIGGSLGGFFTAAGGVSLITFGFISNLEPMTIAQRRSAAAQFNTKLRKERNLGPEVDWQNQPARTRGFNPFGWNAAPAPRGIGVKFEF